MVKRNLVEIVITYLALDWRSDSREVIPMGEPANKGLILVI